MEPHRFALLTVATVLFLKSRGENYCSPSPIYTRDPSGFPGFMSEIMAPLENYSRSARVFHP
jgi:hypothetical protein